MLDTPSNSVSDVRLQSFSISYEYPVMFTRDAFSPGNRCLIDTLTRRAGIVVAPWRAGRPQRHCMTPATH